MTRRQNPLLCALTLATTVALAGCVWRGNSAESSIETGREYCNTYELPHAWTFPDGQAEAIYSDGVEFRVLQSRPEQVCATQRLQFAKLVATEMFCFQGDQGQVAPTDPDWERGRLLAIRREEDRPEFKAASREFEKGFRGNRFVFQDYSFRKRGDEWWYGANRTTDYRYVILQSQDNDNFIERSTNIGIFGPAEGNANSPVYIQVFDLTSGRELIVVRWDLSGMFASTVLSATGWLDDRTFLSMQNYSNKIIVCRLP